MCPNYHVKETSVSTRARRTLPVPSLRSAFAAVATTALVAAAIVVPSLAASAAPTGPGGIGHTTFEAGRYIVTLTGSSVATYEGGVAGYPGTRPDEGDQLNARRGPVQDYSQYLAEKQEEVAAEVGVTIDVSYTMAINGFSADLTAEQAAALAADRDVAALTPDELKHITAEPSTAFLGLEGDDGVWASIGGAEHAGEGIVLGVLDTGIAPENPAFAGSPLGSTAGAEPYLEGDTITFGKADGGTFRGICETGEQFTAEDCTTKVIGARYYLDGFGAENLGDPSTGSGEFVSPRDGDGHGSHTASTAAGGVATPASIQGIDFGTITGVAPGAKIAAYKVCWSGPDPAVQTDDGCTTTDLLAGINQAVIDGVDVINYSIGGGAAQTTYSPTDDAFFGAAAAGIFVAASAGNDGPGASTLDNASPWITTVAASTIPSYEATVTFGDAQAFAGASITVDMDPAAEPLTGNLVNSTAVALPDTDSALCAPGSLDPTLVAPDTIIVCERGVYDRVAKSAEVARVGGIGMVLVNRTPGSIDTDFHSVPTVHLDSTYHDAVVAYAATEGATATFTTGNSTDYTPPAPQVAGFSSRGPVLADGSDLLKPDISAPGVSILAAGPNQEATDPTFEFLSGTSMAAPHIAGLALLYLGESPNATPAEIKSAMMTTAYNTLDPSGAEVTDPFAQGAGHVDPTKFFEPGLLYLNGPADWVAYLQGIGYDFGVDPIDPSNLNLASIAVGSLTAPETVTRTVTSTQAGTFEASVEGLAGIDVTVEPSTLTFGGAGESQSYTVTFSRTDAPLDEFATGAVSWASGDTIVRSPVAVKPVTIVAPDNVEGTGTFGSVEVEVTPGGNGDIPLSTTGLTAGQLLPVGTTDEHSGEGTTGDGAEYPVDIPAGAVFARFDLDSVDDAADLDLFVYQLDSEGTPIALWQSATGAADERVDLVAPEAGSYVVVVDVYSSADGTAWDASATSVVPGGAPLTLEPPVLPGAQGVPVSYTASWADLEAFTTYVGLVSYGETGEFTAVQVETGEDIEPGTPINTVLPSISGTPEVGKTLTANPGEWDTDGLAFSYQWQKDGVDIPGATKATYKVKPKDQGAVITVVVTASKPDLPSGTATSEGVTVKYQSTTKLSLSRHVYFSWQGNTATVKVDSADDAAPTGTVTLTINGRSVLAPVTLDASGKATITLPKLGTGAYLVRASYSGDDATAGSQSSVEFAWVVF